VALALTMPAAVLQGERVMAEPPEREPDERRRSTVTATTIPPTSRIRRSKVPMPPPESPEEDGVSGAACATSRGMSGGR